MPARHASHRGGKTAAVTAIADLISPADRDRLLKRLAEWRDLDALVRQRGSLAPLPPPRPLHKMGKRDGGEET